MKYITVALPDLSAVQKFGRRAAYEWGARHKSYT